MSETGLCWLSHDEQMALRGMLQAMQPRIMELELDNAMLRAEIETLQRMRHAAEYPLDPLDEDTMHNIDMRNLKGRKP